MKALALVAAAVLACAIIPPQAFSDDDYNWWAKGTPGDFWSGYSNGTMSYDFSNGTRNDDSHHDDHGPKCAPHADGKGNHKGEKECDGADQVKARGHALGKTLNQTWKNFTTQDNQGPITPEKNRQGLDRILNDMSSSHHNVSLRLGHGHPGGHRD